MLSVADGDYIRWGLGVGVSLLSHDYCQLEY